MRKFGLEKWHHFSSAAREYMCFMWARLRSATELYPQRIVLLCGLSWRSLSRSERQQGAKITVRLKSETTTSCTWSIYNDVQLMFFFLLFLLPAANVYVSSVRQVLWCYFEHIISSVCYLRHPQSTQRQKMSHQSRCKSERCADAFILDLKKGWSQKTQFASTMVVLRYPKLIVTLT